MTDIKLDVSERVRLADIPQGTTYFAVYSATGVCVGRYLTEAAAKASVDRDPDRRSHQAHTR